MDIRPYLRFVRDLWRGGYPGILVVGPARIESGIFLVQLREDGDYLLTVDGKCVSLRALTEEARIGSYSFAYSLLDAPPSIVSSADFGFNVGAEGAGVGRIKIRPQDLLTFADLERRLAQDYEGIIRGTGGFARV